MYLQSVNMCVDLLPRIERAVSRIKLIAQSHDAHGRIQLYAALLIARLMHSVLMASSRRFRT